MSSSIDIPEKLGAWIDGSFLEPAGISWIEVSNPATKDILCMAVNCSDVEVDAAVKVADKAFQSWSRFTAPERARILRNIGDLLHKHCDSLSVIETLDNGKPLGDARKDISKSADTFYYYSELVDKCYGKTFADGPNTFNYMVYEPFGVTAHITPWNYPLRLAMRSVAPALAAGNSVVLKPAEQAPLTCSLIGPLMSEAGLPSGTYNVIPGTGERAGAALAKHSGIRHLSFTGSLQVGIQVMKAAADNVVPVTLELGGKSPQVVMADADVDAAVTGVIKGIFSNSGQICCAGSRLIIADTIADAFVERLIQKTTQLVVAPGMDDKDLGPLISDEQHRRVQSYVDKAKTLGGTILAGGSRPESSDCSKGHFFSPTIISDLPHHSSPAQEEIFGPVLCIFRAKDEQEAITLANDSDYGLVAGVWSREVATIQRLVRQLQVGQVYVNDFFTGSINTPFGGYKKSGIGRERGMEGLLNYLQTKGVSISF